MKNSVIKKTIIRIAIIAVIVAICIFIDPINTTIKKVFMVFKMASTTGNLDIIKGYILSFGIWAPVVSFLLMIFQSIAAPIPAFLITFSNAAIFGWVKGAILSWSSAMAGAVVCFYIARFLGRDSVEKLAGKTSLESVDKFFERYGSYAILIARLLPFMSFDVVSYGAGLTSIGFWSFFWATGLGQLPATIIYSYVGGMLTGGTKMFVFGLMILFAVSILIFMIKSMWNKKSKVKL
ncbi:TVP38/TMEM64 family protein [Dethiothermospora halolimnae]|uniref:TVP38/TMEM64 family protein n=1 Tax=Dethiothermospora halolimnae TaxID=3114390 RepID=UPI003CCBA3BB